MNSPQGGAGAAQSPGAVEYAGSAQQQFDALNSAMAGQAPGSGNWFGRVLNEAEAHARAGQQAGSFATGQAQSLQRQGGVRTRPGPDVGGHHYPGYSQDELHAMVNTRADPSGVNDQGQSFNAVGNGLAEIAQDMTSTASAASAAWQGKAAQGASAFTTAMSSWHGSTGEGAQLAGNRLWEQSQGLQQARAAMPAPVPQPTAADFAKAITSNTLQSALNPAAVIGPLVDQYRLANDNHAQMARVAQQYDSHLGSNSAMPEFTTPSAFSPNPPPGPGAPGGSGAAGGSGPVGGARHIGAGGGASSPRFGGGGTGGGRGGGIAVPAPISGGPGQPVGPGGPPGEGTNLQWAPPISGGPAWDGDPGHLGGGSGDLGGSGGGGLAGVPIGGVPVGGGGGFGSGGDAVRGGSGFGAGRGGFGPGGSGPGAGAGASGGSGGQPGARSGAGAAVAEEAAMGRGVAGARAGGAGGMGAVGGAGRGGKGGEDEEHKRAEYLLEADPESVFGVSERVAPPVIGE